MPAASRTSRRVRARRLGGTFALLVGLVALLAGCSTPGQVKDYNDQTQANFEDACKAANADDGLSDDELDDLCSCWYEAVTDPDDGMSFEQFKQDDENLRDAVDNNTLNNDDDFKRVAPTLYRVVTENCVQTGPKAG